LATLKGKVMESATLQQQALSNTKEQFSNSPDLSGEMMNAIMDALTVHTAMSKQALESEQVRDRLREVLLSYGRLWEDLRARADDKPNISSQANFIPPGIPMAAESPAAYGDGNEASF
jgi:type I restriction enzyme R subunit